MKDGRERTGGGLGAWGMAWNFILLGSLVGTNILTLYNLTVSRELDRFLALQNGAPTAFQVTRLLQEVAALREQLQKQTETQSEVDGEKQTREDGLPHIPELTAYSAMKQLPLGKNPASGEETMVSPVGHACYYSLALLAQYMNYTVGSLCPEDWHLAQSLMMKGCEPLPRRRCFARTPPGYSRPLALPASLWSYPPDNTVMWTHYTCKSFACLSHRATDVNTRTFTECATCFDLEGSERARWVKTRDRLDFLVEDVLAHTNGSVRVGLDLGGGSGTFAARMRDLNVTIITSTLNLGGPFSEMVALRGLLPLYLSVAQRLPFFDNTLDLVHSMHVLSYWMPAVSLEFLLFDVDRVLRPGGLLWLDHFFATADQMASTFAPMIRRLGYLERRWVTANKRDLNGVKNQEVYLSALLEKPVRHSR